MKIRGIKRGQTIELLDSVDSIPDGAEIIVDLKPSSTKRVEVQKPLTDEERLEKLNQLFGVWKEQPELIEIFAEIDKERHSYKGRVIASIDNSKQSSNQLSFMSKLKQIKIDAPEDFAASLDLYVSREKGVESSLE